MDDLSPRQAAREAVARMRAMWPAFSWGDGVLVTSAARQYGEALEEVADADAIVSGVTAAIREVGGRFPPSVADLLAYVRAEIKRRPVVVPENPSNECPVCLERGEDNGVVVNDDGWASCTDGLHGVVWRVS